MFGTALTFLRGWDVKAKISYFLSAEFIQKSLIETFVMLGRIINERCHNFVFNEMPKKKRFLSSRTAHQIALKNTQNAIQEMNTFKRSITKYWNVHQQKRINLMHIYKLVTVVINIIGLGCMDEGEGTKHAQPIEIWAEYSSSYCQIQWLHFLYCTKMYNKFNQNAPLDVHGSIVCGTSFNTLGICNMRNESVYSALEWISKQLSVSERGAHMSVSENKCV